MCFDAKRKQKYHFSNLFLNQVLFIDKNSILRFLGIIYGMYNVFLLEFNVEWVLSFSIILLLEKVYLNEGCFQSELKVLLKQD